MTSQTRMDQTVGSLHGGRSGRSLHMARTSLCFLQQSRSSTRWRSWSHFSLMTQGNNNKRYRQQHRHRQRRVAAGMLPRHQRRAVWRRHTAGARTHLCQRSHCMCVRVCQAATAHKSIPDERCAQDGVRRIDECSRAGKRQEALLLGGGLPWLARQAACMMQFLDQ